MANKHLSHIKSNATVNTYVNKTDASDVISESAYNSLSGSEKENYSLKVAPKLPTPSDILYGELAVNYKDGKETIAIKNDDNKIVEFASKKYVSGLVPTPSEGDAGKFLKGDGTWANPTTTVTVVDKDETLAWETKKEIATVSGESIHVTLPANPNTDTSVSSVSNHYTPVGTETKSASSASGTSGATVQVVTGVTVDAAGHVTAVTSGAATDTTYDNATQSAAGLMSATDKEKLDGIAAGATANVGTITGITMNGASKGTSGNVDLGTVITAHAAHKLTATNGTASEVSQGTEITYVESIAGTTTATSGDLSVSTTRKKITVPANTDRYVDAALFADDSAASSASPVKMTLTRAGSDAVTVTSNIPKVSSTSAGVAPKGASVSTQSQSTKFLREDGEWAAPSYTVNSNSATLKVGDASTKKVSTAETTGSYIQFTGGTNKFTVGDGTNSFDVAVTPSIENNVTGNSLTADSIVLGNGSSAVKTSSKSITTTNPSASSDDTTVPTSKAVWGAIADGIAANDAMVYKGTIAGGNTGDYGALTAAASKGWTYKVTTAGKIDGVAVEIGDMLICNADNTAAATSSNYATIAAKWDFIQTNIDGAVTGPSSSTNAHIAVAIPKGTDRPS